MTAWRSRAGHAAREIALWPQVARARLGRPEAGTVMVLPSDIRKMSSLLRAYNIADGLRTRGWHAIVVPKQLGQGARRRLLRAVRPDLLLVQMSRHPLNDPDLFEGVPYVYDLDDADFLDPKLTDRIARTCRGARAVIAGSRFIADWCGQSCDRVEVVWTGTPVAPGPRPLHADRAPIVTWAQSSPVRYPLEFDFVTRVVAAAAATRPGLRLRLYGWGPDSGSPHPDRLRAAGVQVETRPPMSYDAFLASLREVAVGLSPICTEDAFSRGKSFGKILGYLDAKVPVIASDEADHAAFFCPETGVIDNDPDVWVRAIGDLLDDPARRQAMADAAFADFETRLSTQAAVTAVDRILRKARASVDAVSR